MDLEKMFNHLSIAEQETRIDKALADMHVLSGDRVDEACAALGVETSQKREGARVLAMIREAAPILARLGLLVMG